MPATHPLYAHALQPPARGASEIEHCILASGLTRIYDEDCTLGQAHIDCCRERARGGAALRILEEQAAHPSEGYHRAACTAWDERVAPVYGIRQLARAN